MFRKMILLWLILPFCMPGRITDLLAEVKTDKPTIEKHGVIRLNQMNSGNYLIISEDENPVNVVDMSIEIETDHVTYFGIVNYNVLTQLTPTPKVVGSITYAVTKDEEMANKILLNRLPVLIPETPEDFPKYYFIDNNWGSDTGIIVEDSSNTRFRIKVTTDGVYLNGPLARVCLSDKVERGNKTFGQPLSNGMSIIVMPKIMQETCLDLHLLQKGEIVKIMENTMTCVHSPGTEPVDEEKELNFIAKIPSRAPSCYYSMVNMLSIRGTINRGVQTEEYESSLYGSDFEECNETPKGLLTKWEYSKSRIFLQPCMINKGCKIHIDAVHGSVKFIGEDLIAAVQEDDKEVVFHRFSGEYEFAFNIQGGYYTLQCGTEEFAGFIAYTGERVCLRYAWIAKLLPRIMRTPFCKYPGIYTAAILTLTIYIIILLLVKTFLGFLMALICYYPLKFSFYFFDKHWIKCQSCLQNYHLGPCSRRCVCGREFNSTIGLRNHSRARNCKRLIMPAVKITLSFGIVKLLGACIIVLTLVSFIPVSDGLSTAQIECASQNKMMCYGGTLKATIPGLTGEEFSFHVVTPENTPYGELRVRVKKAGVEGYYTYEYDTGATTEYDVAHGEKCTGSCPSDKWIINRLKAQGAIFKRGRTSRWGCEEFGCLAVNTGCVYGICMNIIVPELTVYKKSQELDIHYAEIHVDFGSLSRNLTVSQKVVNTDFGTVMLNYQDSRVLPDRIALKNHGAIYTGAINSLGEHSPKCGDIQQIGAVTIGKPEIDWDYICHDASKKNVIVRNCFQNTFRACKELDKLSPRDYQFQDGVLFQHLRTGTLTINVKLGNLKLTDYEDNTLAKLGVVASCEGGFGFRSKVDIELVIVADKETTCRVGIEGITLTGNYLRIKKGKFTYKITGKTSENKHKTEISVCQFKYPMTCQLEESKDKYITLIDEGVEEYLSNPENSCDTLFCHLTFELPDLLSSFLTPLFIGLGIVLVVYIVFKIMQGSLSAMGTKLKALRYEYEDIKVD